MVVIKICKYIGDLSIEYGALTFHFYLQDFISCLSFSFDTLHGSSCSRVITINQLLFACENFCEVRENLVAAIFFRCEPVLQCLRTSYKLTCRNIHYIKIKDRWDILEYSSQISCSIAVHTVLVDFPSTNLNMKRLHMGMTLDRITTTSRIHHYRACNLVLRSQ